MIYYRVLFTPQKRNLIMFRGKTQDGLWQQVVARGSRRRSATQVPQALREHARKPQAGQKRPWNAKDVLRADLFDHIDGKLDVEQDEDSEGDKTPDEFEPPETRGLFRRELYLALANSNAALAAEGSPPRVATVVFAGDIGRELLQEEHKLVLEALALENTMSAQSKAVVVFNAAPANVTPVAPVASAKMVPNSMADFVEMWGKRGCALHH